MWVLKVVLKEFFKKIFLRKLIVLVFSDRFDVLMLKINFKKYKILFQYIFK